MKGLILLLSAIINLNAFAQSNVSKKNDSKMISVHSPEFKIINFNQLQNILNRNDNTLYVVNFWATWCKPCVAELPEFMEVNNMYKQKPGYKMILISLDMADNFQTGVKSFLLKNKIDTDVYLLDDNKRMNEWIPAVDKSWSGAIPATVLYKNGKKLDFIENKMQKNQLIQLINNHL